MNNKYKISVVFIMAAVLFAGTISMTIPKSFAQSYDQQPYEDPYVKDNKKSTSVNIQKIKCINENTNVNGLEITEIPQNSIAAVEAQAEDAGAANGNGLLSDDGINFDKNLVNVCVNVNVNEQVETEQPRDSCADCFIQNLDGEEIGRVLDTLGEVGLSLQSLCEFLESDARNEQKLVVLDSLFDGANVNGEEVLECLDELGLIVLPPPT